MSFDADIDGTLTLCRKDNGKTVAVSLNAAMQPFAPEMRDIMPKAVSGTATAEELKRFGELWQARVKAFLIDLADNPNSSSFVKSEAYPFQTTSGVQRSS